MKTVLLVTFVTLAITCLIFNLIKLVCHHFLYVAVGSSTRRAKRAIFALIAVTASVTLRGQVLALTPLGPKAADKDEVIKEFKNFIIYKGDTLNRKDKSERKTGSWIEYEKVYLRKTNGSSTLTDSTNVSYVIKERGIYVKGRKNGLWNSYYRDGRIKDSMKCD